MLKILTLALLLLVGCTDGAANTPPPSCADLGCGSAALCNRKGECVCDGMACCAGSACDLAGSGSGSGSGNVSTLDDASAL